MSPAATESTAFVAPAKANIGIFTNPAHDLWVAETTPSLDSVKKGEDLKEGDATIATRSTGICEYGCLSP